MHLLFISQIRACMTSTDLCMDWGPTPAVRVASYCQLVTDTSNMNRYERDMCTNEMCISARICGRDVTKSNNIQTDIHRYKSSNEFFSGKIVHTTIISVYISFISGSYLCISCLYNVYMFKYPLLRGKIQFI